MTAPKDNTQVKGVDMPQPKDQPVDELREKAYALARELVEYEFHSPQARFKSEIELAKDYCEQILELCQAECNRARLQELYDWKNNSPAGREMYVDKRIKKLQQIMKGRE